MPLCALHDYLSALSKVVATNSTSIVNFKRMVHH
jgi:hypothetical protein